MRAIRRIVGHRTLRAAAAVAVAVVFAAGCAAGPATGREKGAATGAVLGAGTGAIIGSASGDAGEGALIGGALGAITGGLLGDRAQARDDRQRGLDSRLDAQEQELARNQELIEKLRARNLQASESERGVVVTLPDVLFRFGKDDLTGDARATTRQIAEIITQDAPGRRITVEGHTDSVGPSGYNQGLSERRAQAVASALVAQGVSAGRVSSRGFGEDYPVAPNAHTDGADNPGGRARNRRVEVVILNRPAAG